MNNFQVGAQIGATADFLMKTFKSSKNNDTGAFSFENAFESKVNDVKSFDSFESSTDSNAGEYENQFSYEEKRFDEPEKREESKPRQEEVKPREENVETRREDEKPVEDERVEEKPVKEEAKEQNDSEETDKSEEKEAKSEDKDSKDESEEEGKEAKEAESEEEGKEANSDGKEEKQARGATELKDVEIKIETAQVEEVVTDAATDTEVAQDAEEETAVEAKEEDVKVDVDIEATLDVKTEEVTEEVKEVKPEQQGKVQVTVEKQAVDQQVVGKVQKEDVEEEVVEEAVGVKSETTDQGKQQDKTLQQAAALKNKDRADQKKFVRKQDMADRLEKETGVKIDKMSMEKEKNTPDASAQKTSKDLLKTLDSNRRRFDVKQNRSLRAEDTEIKELASDKPELKLNKLDVVKNFIRNTAGKLRPEAQGQQANTPDSQNSFANTLKEQGPAAKAAKTMQQAPTGQPADLRNMNNIQDIMNNLKTMLRGADLEAKAKLVLDFQTQALGQMRMGVVHKSDGIEVSIEVGNDSSRQELMKQKEELSEQLKNLGYKFASVDISYGDHQQREDAKQQMQSGNEDIRNVKLSGDDGADLDEILAMT